jgi:hypothetical protein
MDDVAAADFIEQVLFELAQQPKARTREAEYLGVVAQQPNGDFWQGPFFELGKHGGGAELWVPQGAKPVAFVHNHPGASKRSLTTDLSPDDVAAADRFGIPIYALSQAGAGYGESVRYTPGTTPKNDVGGATGDAVLAQFPWDAQKRKIMVEILERDINDERGVLR